MMKICFIGLGSIGKRHLLNLTEILKELNIDFEIHALRKTDMILEDNINALLSKQLSYEDQLDGNYDITFITNPTNLHYDTIRLMKDRTSNMFIEKPIFDKVDDNANELIDELANYETCVYYVAGPLRFSPVIQGLKRIVSK